MKDSTTIVKITDVAKATGVSAGTIDRVIHGRSGVSLKTKEIVLKAIEELGYKPNLLASALASRKRNRVTLFLAEDDTNWWKSIELGIDNASKELAIRGLEIFKVRFNRSEPLSFTKAFDSVKDEISGGVIFAQPNKEELKPILLWLKEKSINYGYLETNPTDNDYLISYIPNHSKVGYVGAKLLTNTLPEGSKIIIVKDRTVPDNGGQIATQRFNGFMSYINENRAGQFGYVNIDLTEDDIRNRANISDILRSYTAPKATVCFGPGAAKFSNYLKSSPKSNGIKILTFDFTEENIACLKDGTSEYIVTQNPYKQGYNTLILFFEKLNGNQDCYKVYSSPIDIILKENYEEYIKNIEI